MVRQTTAEETFSVGSTALKPRIEQMYNAGFDLHGSLELSLGEFARRALEIVAKYTQSEEVAAQMLRRLVGADLYLATACAQRSEAAWARFYEVYGTYLEQCIRKLSRESHITEELLDIAYTDLFLPDSSGRSRIGSYDGRASLSTWLRVIISNRVANERSRKCNLLRTDAEVQIDKLGERRDIDSVLDAERYRLTITECLMEAGRSLSPKERLMILYRYERNFQLDKIARMWHVHPSTVNRTLERALQKMRHRVSQMLVARLRLSETGLAHLTSTFAAQPIALTALLSCFRETEERDSHNAFEAEHHRFCAASAISRARSETTAKIPA